MSYTRIPQSNTSRNENQMRAGVDNIATAHTQVVQMADKIAQMNLDGGATRVAQEFNLGSDQEAQDIIDLYGSVKTEIMSQSPFQTQLKQRLG